MPNTRLPKPPSPRAATKHIVAVGIAALLAGCSGDGAKPKPPDVVGPVVDTGPQFPIAATRVDARVFTMRTGDSLPPDALELIRAQSQSLPEPLRASLAARGLMGALLNDQAVASLERALAAPPPPPSPPAPSNTSPQPASTGTGSSGFSVIGGASTPEPVRQYVVQSAPQGAPIADIAVVPIRPGSTWSKLLDAPTHEDSWALALDQAVTSIKPGTLRWYVRTWPAPAEPIPTAGMAAEMHVQLLPVVTGPQHEAQQDPLAPPALTNDLTTRGLVLGRQSVTVALREGSSLVLIAKPKRETATVPGPITDAAPMLGQALLGPGPTLTAGGQTTGPRVLIMRAFVPGTYRLLLDRPSAPPAN